MPPLTRSSNFLRYLTSRSTRFLSSESGSGENDNGAVNVDKLIGFFKQAEEKVAKEVAEKAAKQAEEKLAKEAQEKLTQEPAKLIAETPAFPPVKQESTQTTIKSTDSSLGLTSQDQHRKDDNLRRFSTAPRFVPWTSNRLLKEYKLSRAKVVSQLTTKSKPFATLLRGSTFVQLGNFNQREVVGVVIENVNDSDLYVDFGGKFLAVVSQPENSFYPRGSLVRIRLRDPEMANRFMVNTKAISLLEADAILIGPYRGQLTPNPDADSASPVLQSNKDILSTEHWKL
ncbi:unnamed protein product [Hymenolepis diminuta]|uniref:Uncharacterized protein n=1 Tax=Hymenolepis diminuta TaxID=6216 RepID=A0A564YE80_HYMDI|nr:unnamed protein product [Hymenolepis diminuta]